MKELSIEDKAKRYDEAIKFAYNKHRFSSNLSEIKLIEELFPELREDEREIPISEQKSAEEYNITGIGSKNAQGKLGEMIERKLEIEKQGEQKPAPIFRIDDTIIAKDGTYIKKEPFHIDKIEDDCYWDGENTILVCNQDEFEVFEQKSAWSEEDEERYLSCLRILSTSNIEQPETVNTVWLKSIKERVQSKQELSEDTQQWIDAIIKDYEGLYGINKDFRAIIQIKINILKSLKNRCAWKPSDEQIKGIECAIKTLQHQLNVGDKRLNSLYSDLMKLKE